MLKFPLDLLGIVGCRYLRYQYRPSNREYEDQHNKNMNPIARRLRLDTKFSMKQFH